MKKILTIMLLAGFSSPLLANTDEVLLQALLDQAVIPSFQRVLDDSDVLQVSTRHFCQNPSVETLASVKTAYHSTRVAWSRAEMYLMGPAKADFREFRINFWPTKKRKIKKLLAADQAVTANRISTYSLGGRGLPAMEYLLYQADASGNTGITSFTDETGAQRCSYLSALGADLQLGLSALIEDWGPYRKQMLAPDGKGEFDSAHNALEWLVNTLIAGVEKIEIRKLGDPVGAKSGGVANAYKLEAWRSRDSLALARAGMTEFSTLSTQILVPYLQQSGHPDVAGQLLQANDQALEALAAISMPLFDAVNDEQARVRTAERAVRNVVQVLKLSVAKVLDVRLGFNDNDGD